MSAAEPRPIGYLVAVGFASTAYLAAFTASALAAPEMTGVRSTSGLPNAFGIGGTALAAVALSFLMSRRGRRAGLALGFGLGALGGVGSLVALIAGSLPLLLAASVAFGFGNGAIYLARYAASDDVAPERRANVVGLVVWGSTAGAVLGPNLLGPADVLAGAAGRSEMEGAFVLSLIGFVVAALVCWLLVPTARTGRRSGPQPEAGAPSMAGLLTVPRVQTAIIGLVSAQVVMVLLMTMTPLHVREAGHGVGEVGFVISAHTMGMFALSPITARLVERLGAVPVMLAGFCVLVVAALVAAGAPHDAIPQLSAGLFLLGYGWNLSFVASSTLLARGAESAERVRLQGLADALGWTGAGAASIAAGPLLDAVGYGALSLLGAALVVLPALLVLARRSTPPHPEATRP